MGKVVGQVGYGTVKGTKRAKGQTLRGVGVAMRQRAKCQLKGKKSVIMN